MVSALVCYLDHAAATPVDQAVVAAMLPYMTEQFYNPSSPYAPAVAVRRAYEAAKGRIAQACAVKADELVMTAGATESINLAFQGSGGHVVVPAIEHHAVLAAAARHDHTVVAVGPSGRVDPAAIAAAIRPDTSLVSVAVANHELGTVQPLARVAAVVQAERQRRQTAGETRPIWLHTDASQGLGQIEVRPARLGVDMMSLNAGKVYGPKQVGALWASRQVALRPVVVGGGQERGLRSGTENVAGVIGMALALERANRRRPAEAHRLAELRDRLEAAITAALPQVTVTGDRRHRLPGHSHLVCPGLDAERLVFRLEARGVLVATGSACAANQGTRSHVLTAIGLTPEHADGSLRLTLGRLTTEATVNQAIPILIEELQGEYARVAA